MIYDISLKISYAYNYPAAGGRHLLHMSPIYIKGVQEILKSEIAIFPEPSERIEELDFFQNKTVNTAFHKPHQSVEFIAKSRVKRLNQNTTFDGAPLLSDMKKEVRNVKSLGPNSPHHFTGPSQRIPSTSSVHAYAAQQVQLKENVVDAVMAISSSLHNDMRFDANATNVDTPYEQAFANRHGVCQDYSHIMIACLRSLHIPAAYVSGYLRTIPPEGQPRLEGADAMHAWVRAWLGHKIGWVEFDPTNNLLVGTDHIVIGYGRDYSDIAPIKGVLRSEGTQASSQNVDVIPV